jgi:nicotinamidase-related amidase
MRDALLVIDVQQRLVDELEPTRRDEFTATLRSLVASARRASRPIVYVRDGGGDLEPGTPGWEIAREIAPEPGDPIVDKRFRDAFRETDLADVLAARSVRHAIVCGMHTEFCVDATVREAERRGYRVTLVADGHATLGTTDLTETQIRDHTHRVLAGRIATIVPAAEIP